MRIRKEAPLQMTTVARQTASATTNEINVKGHAKRLVLTREQLRCSIFYEIGKIELGFVFRGFLSLTD